MVYGPSEEFFASARFAENEHRSIRRGDLFDLMQHLSHSRTLAEDVVEVMRQLDFFLQIDIFSL